MRFLRSITIGAVLLLAQLSAFGAEIAVLRNGFSIRFEHKEQTGNTVRLYTGTGYVDIANDQIASFEAEEAPIVVTPEPAAAPQNATPVPAVTSQPVTPVKAATAVNLDDVIREASRKNRLDPDFVSSVIKAESNFKTRAVSRKGAQGLMQLMPATASQLGVADAFDPRANVEAGTAHLSALLDQYHDDPVKALAAYNAGAHRVKQYNGVPPYRETRAYISKIVRDFNAKKRAQMKATAATTSAKGKTAGAPAKTVKASPSRKNKPQQAQITKPTSPA
ncbi:MAG TPA: lytic transglycosylase domain-containing protein [Candidatus Sulfotelmatobacter sp.]|nr:lytic transglycosylase domain-containing protein [Candidatus Sulfotelmatobacter sp.]